MRRWITFAIAATILLVTYVSCFGYRSGRHVCGVCGEHERRKSIGPLVVSRSELPSDFREFFLRNDGPAHDHRWLHAGCHGIGFPLNTLACSPDFERNALFERIMDLKDPIAIRRALALLASMDKASLRMELKEAPFFQLEDERYMAWWNSHPRWQEIFPRPRTGN